MDGPVGQDQRRFCLQNLKAFGFGRSTMEQRIILEASELISWLKIKCKVRNYFKHTFANNTQS